MNAEQRAARQDRDAVIYPKLTRGHQMGLAFVAAVLKPNAQKQLAQQVGRSIQRMN